MAEQLLAPERELERLIRTPALDERVRREPGMLRPLDAWLEPALTRAWSVGSSLDAPHLASERLVTQRLLYEVNRLRLFWFDDPAAYENEQSQVLQTLARRIEIAWQRWLEARVPQDGLRDDLPSTLRAWSERDCTPRESPDGRWWALEANLAAYRRLLEIQSVNALVEASQLSRVLGGASHPVQATLTRILLEEYGGGRLHRKHSTFFAAMLEALGMETRPEAYLRRVPWEVLAAINHAFHLAEKKRLYVRFCGAFTYTEVSTPASFRGYAEAARRLGLSDGRADYWTLHIKEDARHGRWMVEEAALPIVERFPAHGPDLLFGYAQQRLVESDAARATTQACRAAHEGS